jgi:hypothetical protein
MALCNVLSAFFSDGGLKCGGGLVNLNLFLGLEKEKLKERDRVYHFFLILSYIFFLDSYGAFLAIFFGPSINSFF